MLPEMFCSAYDCACMPVTAVVRASKIPIVISTAFRAARRNPCQSLAAATRAFPSQAPCQQGFDRVSLCHAGANGDATGLPSADLPRAGKKCRAELRSADEAEEAGQE